MSEPRPVPELTPEFASRVRAHQQRISRLRRRIAVVGMSCRLPGASSPAAFWRGLAAGRNAVTEGRPDTPAADRDTAWGGYLEDLDRLDAGFFRIAPVEAELMDPQQRLLLEVSWEALEDAGMDPGLEGRRGGVYVGIGNGDYQRLLEGVERSVHSVAGGSLAAAPGRVAFTLGWTGPAIAVDTACSSSLVAIHQAISGLQRGEADLALAGGVNVVLDTGWIEPLRRAGMLAPDGRCKAFDAAADGFVRGEGCGMLVLKRLGDAERDGDRILGVLLGSAVNQDGASAGLTVPNGPAQEAVIREALGRAGVEPATVDYLEAHGTGTELGDPIEVGAAAAAYGEGRDAERPLLLGSVKTNVGHLESAAGVAGVIKALLALRHRVIPPHLHFETPNPRIAWDSLPVWVTAEATTWPEVPGRPARAAVSSFSLFGTNAHLVIEAGETADGDSAAAAAVPVASASGEEPAPGVREARVLPLSGRSGKALSDLAGRYRESLGREPGQWTAERLADAVWTAGVGRSHFAVRAGLVFRGVEDLVDQLLQVEDGREREAGPGFPGGGPVAFLFTGQGSQWVGMGRDLYACEPRARAVLERCEEAFRAERGESLLAVMFGRGRGEELDRTEWTQPALFALSAALTEVWKSVGVVPDAVLGHSAGEIAAAWAAGAVGLGEGMRFAVRRGSLLGSLPAGGGMAAVFAGPDRVRSVLAGAGRSRDGADLALAAENGTHCVVSGPEALLALAEGRFREGGVRTERLRTSHAFHSGLLDPVLAELEAAAGEVAWRKPEVPLVSNLTGRVLGAGEVLDGGYWRRQARSPVRFASGVDALAELGARVLVEIGPRPVLGPLAALAWPESGSGRRPAVVSSLARETGFPEAVASAYEAGLRLEFAGLHAGERRRRVALPTYPFQRDRYWLKATRPGAGEGRTPGARDDVEELLYEVVWRDAPAAGAGPVAADFLRGPEQVSLAASDAGALFEAEGLGAAARRELDRGLGDLARSFAVSALAALGWERRAGAPVEAESLRRRLRVVSGHRGVFLRLLALLEEAGVLVRGDGGSGWLAAPETGAPPAFEDPDEAAERLLGRCPAGSAEIGLLRRCGSALPEVLRGRADPLDLLFGGSPNAADVYRNSPGARALSRLVAEAVASAASERPAGRRLRVLEVGAGTGGTTEAMLAALSGGNADYLYTDVSAAFFPEARERFAGPAADAGVRLEFRGLDIERDPAAQGFGARGYDLVVAANVLHATRDIAASLENCRRLLAPSGLLVALEAMERRSWLDLTFSLLPGWWRFSDPYRTEHPLAGPSAWRRALADSGYGEVAILGGGGSGAGAGPDGVIVARAPAEASADAGLWVVWPAEASPEEASPGRALVRELEARGQRVIVAAEGERDGGSRDAWRELFSGIPAGELAGVVHCGAAEPADGGETAGGALAEALERSGKGALALSQGLLDAGVTPRSGLWFVTRGGQVLAGEPSGELAGAALWGFGRALARELPQLGTRLVDLDPRDPDPAGKLADELLFPDREPQIAVRGGRRLAPRLVRGAASRASTEQDATPGPPESRRPRADRTYLVTGGLGGATLTAKSDAFAVRTSTDTVSGDGGRLEGAQADVTRLRFALEGSRVFALSETAVLTPSLELGVRHDGGDAETGFGADIGAGVALSDQSRGLSAELRARGLLTHEADGLSERGLSGTLAFDPTPETERGFSLSLTQTMGGQASGGADALLERTTLAGLGADDGGLSGRRLDAQLGYGFAVFDERYTATPELGLGLSDADRELRLGWRLAERVSAGLAFELGLEGTRREYTAFEADTEGGAEHGLVAGAGWRLVSRDAEAFEVRIEVELREAASGDAGPEHRVGLRLGASW